MPASRARVIKLLRQAGIEVYERTLTYQEVMDADECSRPAITAGSSP
jgi:branched-subunit amino acid aminotransferase/4-amino-4-deoxychorismate lyase